MKQEKELFKMELWSEMEFLDNTWQTTELFRNYIWPEMELFRKDTWQEMELLRQDT